MTICDQKPLKSNHVNFGDAGTSKSYLLVEVLPNLFIPGTYSKLKWFSSKAFDGSKNLYDMMILLLDEIHSSSIKDNNNSCEDDANNLKFLMSNGHLGTARCKMTDDGEPSLVLSEAHLKVWIAGNTNLFLSQIMKPIVDRCITNTVNIFKREDKNTTEVNINANSSRNIGLQNRLNDYMKRTQYLISMALLLIHVGLMEPVNMFSVNMMQMQIEELAKKHQFKNMNAHRKKKTLIQLVNIVTIFRAIVTVFDHPNSSLYELDWKPQHIFEIEKHLVATPDDLIFVMGLIEHQFESPHDKYFFNILGQLKKQELKTVDFGVATRHHDTHGYYIHDPNISNSNTFFYLQIKIMIYIYHEQHLSTNFLKDYSD